MHLCLFASNGSTSTVRQELTTAAVMRWLIPQTLLLCNSMLPRSSRAELTKSQYSSWR